MAMPEDMQPSIRPLGGLAVVLAVVFTILAWSSNFPTIRFILRSYDAPTLSALRIGVGAIALGLTAVVVRMPLPPRRDWPAMLLFGLTGIALATLCLNLGLRSLTAGGGSFLIGTVPIFSALLARAFFRERLGVRAWFGIAVSFAGVALIGLGEGGGLHFDAGALFVLGSAANQAFYYVFQKHLHGRYSPLQITSCSIWCGALILLALNPTAPARLLEAPLAPTLAIVYLGCVPTALAFLTWNYALSHARAAKVTSSMYAMPALAIALAFGWLGEVPSLLSLLGGVIALSGVAMVHLWNR